MGLDCASVRQNLAATADSERTSRQKGLLGSTRMEQILNAEGARGWELVSINMERATLKRRVTNITQAELEIAAEDTEREEE